MRLSKILVICLVALLATGCSCRTKQVGPGVDNIAVAQPGSDLRDIHFAFDQYSLDASARSILATNAEWLKANANRRAQIEGHTDERGTNEYNMALGARRARATMEYLRSLGVEESRMSTVSYGEELPLDPRSNEEAWAKNRRAHTNVSQ